MKREKTFRKNLNALEEIFRFLEEFIQENQLTEHLAFRMKFAVEELFTNSIKYNTRNGGTVRLILEKTAGQLTISLLESGVERFDVTQVQQYDAQQRLEDRPVGRLGLYLVNKMTDRIRYHYLNGQSQIQLIFFTEKSHA